MRLAPGSRAAVIGLGSVVGLQTARLLSRRGVPVIGITGDASHFAARTRACERVVVADVRGTGFLDALVEMGPGLGEPCVVYPCTDASVLLVSAHRDRLAPWYTVVLPCDDVVRTLADKALFAEHAQRVGLPVPATVVVRSRADAERAAAELPFPAVLKPSLKSATWTRQATVKAMPVDSPQELLAAYDRVGGLTSTLVAQEFVSGADDQLFTYNGYYGRDGTPLASFVTRKRRQWPPHVGTASYGEEWRDEGVLAVAHQLFSSVSFRGLGYVEVKRDPRTGRDVVIEANVGRPTGRSATAEAGGVELLATMHADALGLPLPQAREQREVGAREVGAHWVDLRRDLLSAAYYWRRGELTPRQWLASLRGPTAHAVLSARDPLPFAHELLQSARKAARRAGRR